MKKTKFAYLFATTLVAGTMGLTSCQEEVENPVAKEGSVTIGLSTVATRATADDVNMGDADTDGNYTYATIDNVVVVPMIGNAYQNPILFGDFNPNDTKVKKQTRTMSQAVSRFKVYGNVCDGYVTPAYSALSEAAVFTGLTFTAPTWESGAPADGTYSKPHELYYYYDTNTTGFSASKNEWGTSEPTWTTGVKLLGDNKSVKITPVNYAVGVLAAAIQNGDVTTDFYTNEACSEGKSKFDENKITVSGITIAGQTKSFDADFVAQGGTVNVYETAVADAKVEATKVTNASRTTGDIYSVVAPTTAGTVTLNIEFTVADGVYFKLANGKIAGKDTKKIYLPVVLNKNLATSTGSATNIFEADKATFLNAKVMNWGLASETPVKTTDVTIGVEFDVEWGEGLSFDVEI